MTKNQTSKPTLVMMVGISGSGKSYKANLLSKEYNALVYSSDNLRKELYGDENDQTHNGEVFNELHKRILQAIKNGQNAIMDSTSLTIKDRAVILKKLNNSQYPCFKIAYVMTTSLHTAKALNKKRNRVVPEFVLDRQARKFQIPFYEEGFDDIVLDSWKFPVHNTNPINHTLLRMANFEQHNSHHDFTLLEHCKKTAVYAEKNFNVSSKENNRSFYNACLLHDIGKLDTQEFDSRGEAHYYSHENLGTYSLLQNLDCVGLSEKEDILNFLFLVNYHMLPFTWKEPQTIEKYKNLFGEKKFSEIIMFHECDKKSSKNS